MKKKLTLAVMVFTVLLSCSENENLPEEIINKSMETRSKVVDNSENISKIIETLDKTLEYTLKNQHLNDKLIGDYFIEEARKAGIQIIKISNNEKDSNFSTEFREFSQQIIESRSYNTKDEFKNSLVSLRDQVMLSKIISSEKQIMIDNIDFMIAFGDWMETANDKYPNIRMINRASDCDGWWECWGACAAAIIGGALTGALTGCAAIGSVGAFAGAAIGSIVPALGNAVGAGVGAVAGCGAGGAVGAIAGGLTAASVACD